LAHSLHHAFHLGAHRIFTCDEAARAVLEAARHADFLDVFVQDLLQVFAEPLEDTLVFFFGLFEVHITAGTAVMFEFKCRKVLKVP